jgi:hypothetical protein
MGLLRRFLAVQFISIKDAGFNRKATLAAPFATVAFFFVLRFYSNDIGPAS